VEQFSWIRVRRHSKYFIEMKDDSPRPVSISGDAVDDDPYSHFGSHVAFSKADFMI
jgi:hypothetical protein